MKIKRWNLFSSMERDGYDMFIQIAKGGYIGPIRAKGGYIFTKIVSISTRIILFSEVLKKIQFNLI